MHRVLLLTVLIASLFLGASPALGAPEASVKAAAQEASEHERAGKDPLVVQAEALLVDINRLELDISQLQASIKQTDGEKKASLQLRAMSRALEALKIYTDLTVNIQAQQKLGHNVTGLLATLRSKMLPLGPRIRRAIDRNEDEYQVKVKDLEPYSSEALALFQKEQNFANQAYKALSQHSQNLLLLGFNNQHTQQYLNTALYGRAESLVGQLEITDSNINRVSRTLAATGEDATLRAELLGLEQKHKSLTESLRLVIGLMQENKLDNIEFRQILVRMSGELTSDVLDPEIITGLISYWISGAAEYLSKHSSEMLFRAFVFFGVLTLFFYISRFAKRLVKRGLRSNHVHLSYLMEQMLQAMVGRIIMILGFLIALDQVGVSLAPVLAGLGVAGFIIGFALQDTLSNFASGMMILIYRPYDVGDYIETGGLRGNVKSMNLVSTTLLTIDNQTLVIPNSKIWGDVINNLTAQTMRRVDMTFGVSYSDNLQQVETVLKDIVHNHDKILDEPEPIIRVHLLNESSVDFTVRPWVKTEDYWEVYWDLTRSVKDRFDEEGISIPFPQRDVHVYKSALD